MNSKIIYGIGACDPKGIMGVNGKLPWHCPEDLTHFSNTIHDCPIIMGYRTFTSLPQKYLKGRLNIIFSRKRRSSPTTNSLFVTSLEEFFSLETNKCYLIGGAEIYKLFLEHNLISEFYLTKFKKHYVGDTLFPLELLKGWPSLVIQETLDFTIHQYYYPSGGL